MRPPRAAAALPRLSLRRVAAAGDEPAAWAAVVDGAVVGRVVARECLLANRGRGLLSTGWPQRRGRVWVPSLEGAELGDDERADVERCLARHPHRHEKTNRRSAASDLLEAYDAAGVALPQPPLGRRRAA